MNIQGVMQTCPRRIYVFMFIFYKCESLLFLCLYQRLWLRGIGAVLEGLVLCACVSVVSSLVEFV